MNHPSHSVVPTYGRAVAPGGTVVVSTVASDAHSWNLVFLQLLLEEIGYHVVNLGPCVPDKLLVDECVRLDPVMLVVSSVNGHGYSDGLRIARKLRERPELATTPMVIGGKLGISENTAERERQAEALLKAGFDAVFADSHADELRHFIESTVASMSDGTPNRTAVPAAPPMPADSPVAP